MSCLAPGYRCPTVVVALATLLLPLVGVAAAPAQEPPHWIWVDKQQKADELVYFRKVFTVSGDVKSAVLLAACDDRVSLFCNGKLLVEHNVWQRPCRENLTKRLVKGENVIACRCLNRGDAAGLLVKLVIETADGKTQTLVSDASWKAKREPRENWRVLDYDDGDWTAAVSMGKYGADPWGAIPFDAATSLPLATPPESITVPEGFRVELLYSVPKEEQGSWVSMAVDRRGRLVCCDQNGPLYRVTPGRDADSTKVERLTAAIGQSQGMCFAAGALYLTVNGTAAEGSGFYRLRDTDGDDQFDEVTLLKKFSFAGEHGPHAVRLGPDGMLYIVAGNHTKIPEGIAADSPHRNWAEDLLLPRNPDGRGHATGILAPGGWIARTDLEGKRWELVCAGMRNPYDIGFNQDGELFTYDADMEWDTGTPWYRPTRVCHAVSAAEFGWRYGTGKWPEYYVDSRGPVVNVGLGSPTGITLGTGARLPAKYQRALFINDWTYGKIYAVHLQPQGASYTGAFETFISGRPLPVTDIVVNPHDHALYFTTGGRGTQSGLYRVTYIGGVAPEPIGSDDDEAASHARQLRHKLESYHGRQDAGAIAFAWPHLGSPDRAIRYAARVAVESQDVAAWRSRALAEQRPGAMIEALVALVRAGSRALPEAEHAALQSQVLARLSALPIERLSEEQLLDSLRATQLAFIRLGGRTGEQRHQSARKILERFDPLFPVPSVPVSHELCRLLVYLEAPGVVPRAMKLLAAAPTQQEQLFYVFVLRNVREGWTPDEREAYFSWMNLAESKYTGGASFKLFLQQIRKDAVATLTSQEQAALKDVIEGKQSVEVVKLETTRQFVHNWQMEDLLPLLDQVAQGRSFEKGRQAYEAGQCAKCHRFRGDGASTGPDITGVGNRFDARYLLEALITPSKVVSDQYRNIILLTSAGEVITGRIIDEDARALRIRTSPFATELVELAKDDVEERRVSPLSEMPDGLVNVLTKEEILDLIAYLRSAGDPNDRAFQHEAGHQQRSP